MLPSTKATGPSASVASGSHASVAQSIKLFVGRGGLVSSSAASVIRASYPIIDKR